MAAAASEHPHYQHQHQIKHPHPHHSYPHHLQHHHSMQRDPSREHDRDVHGLRLALGSILSPPRDSSRLAPHSQKRLSTPSSHASSGSTSPCPAHFGPGLVHPYHPGPSHLHTPVEAQEQPDGLEHAVGSQESTGVSAEEQTHLTVPQRPNSVLSSTSSTSVGSFVPDHSHEHDHEAAPPILTTSNVHALSPSQAQSVKDSQADSSRPGALKRAAKEKRERDEKENANARGVGAYIATLQSKRAWDALVHGNMS